MLILTRKTGESIVIDGRIVVKVLRFEGETIKLGIEASTDIAVHRQEVYDEIQQSNQAAVARNGVPLPKLKAPPSTPANA